MATLAAPHVKNDRHVGGTSSRTDVLSKHSRVQHGFQIEFLSASTRTPRNCLYGKSEGQQRRITLEERLQDNTQTPVPDQVAFRIDFPAFLRSLTPRGRRIAEFLALRHSGKHAAVKFQLTSGRITQLRQQWCREWYAMHDEQAPFAQRVPKTFTDDARATWGMAHAIPQRTAVAVLGPFVFTSWSR
jgi:hypothetical protein